MEKQNIATGAAPINSSTIILTRSLNGELEILFVRRNNKLEFMGGYFVFPGGKLDASDCDPDLWENYCRPISVSPNALIQEPLLPELTARGLFMAAIRETFEECGILLAVPDGGHELDCNDADVAGRFKDYRTRLQGGEISLKDIAVKERLRFAPDKMAPYARWITPTAVPKRFDTRFFLAILPEGQQATHDGNEITDAVWMSAEIALHMNCVGQISLSPPNMKMLEDIRPFKDTSELWATTMRREIFPLLPEAYIENGCLGVKLPFDPEYSIEQFKRPPKPGKPSRFIKKDGIWRTAKSN